MGELIPVSFITGLPGAKLKLDNEALARFMPMTNPVMDRFNVTFHRWAVPKRLLWDNYDNYRAMTKIGSPAALPVAPYVEADPSDMQPATYVANGNRLLNYSGIPLAYNADQTDKVRFSPMRLAAYQFIYNEKYRDQNLIPEVTYKLTDGSNNANLNDLKILRKRAWRPDYFTSGLPSAQKGDPIMMPVKLGDAPVHINVVGTGDTVIPTSIPVGSTSVDWGQPQNNAVPILANDLYVDNSNAASTTDLNSFRLANAMQKFQERLMRVGSRIKEFLPGIFGVPVRDSRIDSPEWAGGVIKPITISEVLNTTGTDTLPQGNMSGHGATYIDGSASHYTCDEDMIIVTIMNIQPNGTYFQGVDRELLKINHPTEEFLPDLANLGEQGTYNQEIYAYLSPDLAKGTFNYQARWTEHRFIPNRVFGQMAIDTKLMSWHAARFFANRPQNNQTFVEMTGDGSSDRIFTVVDPDEEKLLVQVYNTVIVVQPIPKMGTPKLDV